jgi:hypothetical protein
MGCNRKTTIKPISTARCNEMIDEIELQIRNKFKTDAKYNKFEREKLISEIKKYPNHVWTVGESGLIHIELA